jgi:hypothetical protein
MLPKCGYPFLRLQRDVKTAIYCSCVGSELKVSFCGLQDVKQLRYLCDNLLPLFRQAPYTL